MIGLFQRPGGGVHGPAGGIASGFRDQPHFGNFSTNIAWLWAVQTGGYHRRDTPASEADSNYQRKVTNGAHGSALI